MLTPASLPLPLSLSPLSRTCTQAIISTLARDHGLKAATTVLLTGCSSGGLAAYLHGTLVFRSNFALEDFALEDAIEFHSFAPLEALPCV
jgi:hypothetical protein